VPSPTELVGAAEPQDDRPAAAEAEQT